MCASSAIVSTVCGWSRVASTWVEHRLQRLALTGCTGVSMNWAWPPSRCGGTTIRRAIIVATAEPCSCRIRCRPASTLAAVPALVRILPSARRARSGRPWPAGSRRASASVCRQWVVQRRSSSRPAAPSANAPVHTLITQAPRAWARRSASRTSAGGSSSVSYGHDDDQVGLLGRARSCAGRRWRTPRGYAPGRRRRADGEVVAGQPLGGAVVAEQLAEHAELEDGHVGQGDHGDVAQHACQPTARLAGF